MSEYRKKQAILYDSHTSSTSYQESKRAQISMNVAYDWRKFKIQTICNQTPVSEYTLENFLKCYLTRKV